MNRNSALGLRAACAKVISVIDDWENVDVTGLDVEDTIRRFQNVHARDFNPSSLDVYSKRFRNAIESFLAYAKDPGSWKPSTRNPRKRGSNGQAREKPPARPEDETEMPRAMHGAPSGRGLIEYPFPVRETLVARLILPRDLTSAEAKRIHGFMLALAVDTSEDS